MLDLLPAPALGLLTSALAVPGMVLGSILETSALPALGDASSSSSPPGDYIQPPAGSAGQCAGKYIFWPTCACCLSARLVRVLLECSKKKILTVGWQCLQSVLWQPQ